MRLVVVIVGVGTTVGRELEEFKRMENIVSG